jgi:hypothetical protein
MRNAKHWLAAACVVSALFGVAALLNSISAPQVAAQEKGPGDHWRFHDGHWSMWHAADKRWYYTDGNHWFFHDGNAWRLYRFDARFGRNGWEPIRLKVEHPGHLRHPPFEGFLETPKSEISVTH